VAKSAAIDDVLAMQQAHAIKAHREA